MSWVFKSELGAKLMTVVTESIEHENTKGFNQRLIRLFIHQAKKGEEIDDALMDFIVTGLESHLAGKKPWKDKRGQKTKELKYLFPYYYEYLRQYGSKGMMSSGIADAVGGDIKDQRQTERYVQEAKKWLEGDDCSEIENFLAWCEKNNKEIPKQSSFYQNQERLLKKHQLHLEKDIK